MVTPKLRFKGFDESWKSLKYEDVLNIKYGKDHKLLESGDIPVYGTGGVMRYVDRSLYEGESILIGRKGTIDKPKYVNERFWTVDTLFYTEIKEDAIAKFIYQHALQVNWLGLNEATGVPSLNTKSISSIEINTPCLEEQTKIASFLSAVDDKIAQLSQEHELLSKYKKGMMQQLFSQKLRFKADDGSDFEDWKIVKLKDILIDYKLGGNYSNSLRKTDFPLIKMGNLGRGSININKIEYITHGEDISSDDAIQTNDLFFNTRNTLDLVGKVAIWRGELPTAYYNSNLMRLKFENNMFMNYLFNEETTLKKLKAIASGTTSVAAIYTKDLLKMNLNIPSLIEQTKIANFLSAIDQKIDNVAAQIDQAQVWKKGLLQQMFV